VALESQAVAGECLARGLQSLGVGGDNAPTDSNPGYKRHAAWNKSDTAQLNSVRPLMSIVAFGNFPDTVRVSKAQLSAWTENGTAMPVWCSGRLTLMCHPTGGAHCVIVVS
jgi:hypothetical protein